MIIIKNMGGNYNAKKNKEVAKIQEEFKQILNDIWCIYSFDKGIRRWHKICTQIPEPFSRMIDVEIQHVSLGYGIEQARLAVKDEMDKYIEYLIAKQ